MTEAKPDPDGAAAPAQDGDAKPEPGNGARTAALIGAATGIGSAALLAALLYANRSRSPRSAGKPAGDKPKP